MSVCLLSGLQIEAISDTLILFENSGDLEQLAYKEANLSDLRHFVCILSIYLIIVIIQITEYRVYVQMNWLEKHCGYDKDARISKVKTSKDFKHKIVFSE